MPAWRRAGAYSRVGYSHIRIEAAGYPAASMNFTRQEELFVFLRHIRVVEDILNVVVFIHHIQHLVELGGVPVSYTHLDVYKRQV